MNIILVGNDTEVEVVYKILLKKKDENLSIELCFWNNYKDVQNLNNIKNDIDIFVVVDKVKGRSKEITNMLICPS